MEKMNPRMTRREKTPRMSAPDYVSGSKSNPHAEPRGKSDSFYTDHGRGNHFGESSVKKEGGKNIKGTPGSTAH